MPKPRTLNILTGMVLFVSKYSLGGAETSLGNSKRPCMISLVDGRKDTPMLKWAKSEHKVKWRKLRVGRMENMYFARMSLLKSFIAPFQGVALSLLKSILALLSAWSLVDTLPSLKMCNLNLFSSSENHDCSIFSLLLYIQTVPLVQILWLDYQLHSYVSLYVSLFGAISWHELHHKDFHLLLTMYSGLGLSRCHRYCNWTVWICDYSFRDISSSQNQRYGK